MGWLGDWYNNMGPQAKRGMWMGFGAGAAGLAAGGAFSGLGSGSGTSEAIATSTTQGSGATSVRGGGAVGDFFKRALKGGNGNWLPYLIMAAQTIPAAKQAMLGKQMFEEGSKDYETYMKQMNALISARAQQHTAWGTMISEGIQPGQTVPAIDYGKIFGPTESYLTSGSKSPGGSLGPPVISHATGTDGKSVTGQSWGFTGVADPNRKPSFQKQTLEEYQQNSPYSDFRDWAAYKIFGKGN